MDSVYLLITSTLQRISAHSLHEGTDSLVHGGLLLAHVLFLISKLNGPSFSVVGHVATLTELLETGCSQPF